MNSSLAAAAFVYVSNADDGDIGMYAMRPDGSLEPGPRFAAEKTVMPMTLDPARGLLIAAVRAEPYTAYSYRIDRASGALEPIGTGRLAGSLPYVSLDRSGRFLLGASYAAHFVSVNRVRADGRVGKAIQVMPTARHAHSIRVERTNRFAFAAHLGTDQVFQFRFDSRTGKLSPNTPPVLQLEQGTGPRHFVFSPDDRFAYLLNELTGTVNTLALDGRTGLLTEVASASILPPESKLRPGVPRGAAGVPGAYQGPRGTSNDIWASDLRLAAKGKLLYAAERTSSTVAGFRVDPRTGALAYLGSTLTERQPRGFQIDPSGRTMVVSGERSATISSYSIDLSSGALRLIGQYPTGKGSNWVEIVSFDRRAR